jgi:hypothetical protein
MQQPVHFSQKNVFAHFHLVAVKRRSSMMDWLLGLPGQILCEQSPWCQRKWWACSWVCSSPASPFSVCPELSMSFKHPCTAHAFFPERLCKLLPGPPSHFLGFAQNLIHTRCRIHREIASGQTHDSK